MRLVYLSFLAVGFMLWGCQSDDGLADCPTPGPKGFDVVTGPLILPPALGGDAWGFVSDDWGGPSEAVVLTGYPFFLNYEGACQESYTLNVVDRIESLISSGLAERAGFRFSSYVYQPANQAISLLRPVEPPRYPYFTWLERTITVQNVPSGYSWEVLPESTYVPLEIDEVQNEIRINLPLNIDIFKYYYLVGVPEGSDDPAQALLINFAGGSSVYDFSAAAKPLTYRTITIDGDAVWAQIGEVLDASEGSVALLGHAPVINGRVSLPVVNPDAPHHITISSQLDTVVHNTERLIYDGFPERVLAPVDPIGAMVWTESHLSITLNQAGYLMIETGPQRNTNNQHYRRILGVFPAGEHRIALAQLPDNYKAEHPTVYMPTDLYKNGFDLTYYNFPQLSNLDDYWRLTEQSWATLQNHQYYSRQVN